MTGNGKENGFREAEAVLLAKEASVNLNLSDFALFLSVMKNKKAFQNVLEIILDEPIDLEEVKVEEVILNSRGQRAIRLDAWARSSDKRQFAVEMQNDTEKDDVRKRIQILSGAYGCADSEIGQADTVSMASGYGGNFYYYGRYFWYGPGYVHIYGVLSGAPGVGVGRRCDENFL